MTVKGPSQTAAESSGCVESASQNARRQVFSLFLHMTLHPLEHSLVRAHVYRHIIDRIAHISPLPMKIILKSYSVPVSFFSSVFVNSEKKQKVKLA